MASTNLVATHEKLRAFFPDAREPLWDKAPGIMSADFPITPELCTTALGRWLAATIYTTRFDDDASRCTIILPSTEQGLRLRDTGQRLIAQQGVRSRAAADRVLADLERWIAAERANLDAYGTSLFQFRAMQFQWPVFGSAAAASAHTPEQYFDFCAGQIRATGGVILGASLFDTPLPDDLARTMAPKSGGGDSLLRQYAAQKAQLQAASA